MVAVRPRPVGGRRDFADLTRRGRSVSTPLLGLRVLLGGTETRVSYSVARTVGSAVTRNLVRRRLRALVAGRSLDVGRYLFSVRPAGAGATFDQLAQAMDTLLSRAGVGAGVVAAGPAGDAERAGRP